MKERNEKLTASTALDADLGSAHSPGFTRRSFVGGVVAAAGLLAAGGAAKAFASGSEQLRPPGGQDEERLRSLCIRCDRCRAVCPTHAIGVASLSLGLMDVRMPVMAFRKGFCDMCDGELRCVAACSSGALKPFDPCREKIGMAVIDTKECQLFGYSATCSAPCVDACSWDALSLNANGRLVVDESRCNGCGACENACPTSAYGNYDSSGRRGINVEVFHG